MSSRYMIDALYVVVCCRDGFMQHRVVVTDRAIVNMHGVETLNIVH